MQGRPDLSRCALAPWPRTAPSSHQPDDILFCCTAAARGGQLSDSARVGAAVDLFADGRLPRATVVHSGPSLAVTLAASPSPTPESAQSLVDHPAPHVVTGLWCRVYYVVR